MEIVGRCAPGCCVGDDAWPSTPSEIVGWEMGARTCLHATPMHHPCTKPLPQNSLSHPAENWLNHWVQVVRAGRRFSGIVGNRPFWAVRGPGGPPGALPGGPGARPAKSWPRTASRACSPRARTIKNGVAKAPCLHGNACAWRALHLACLERCVYLWEGGRQRGAGNLVNKASYRRRARGQSRGLVCPPDPRRAYAAASLFWAPVSASYHVTGGTPGYDVSVRIVVAIVDARGRSLGIRRNVGCVGKGSVGLQALHHAAVDHV